MDDTRDGGSSSPLSLNFLSFGTIELAVSLLCAYVIAQYLYLLLLHPLAEYPGPKLCAVSRVPYWLATIKGKDVRWLFELHKKYGPVVRFGPTDLSYATAQAWKDIHGYSKGRSENGKAPEFSVQPANGMEAPEISCILSLTRQRCSEHAERHL